jgi:hypothetical protein
MTRLFLRFRAGAVLPAMALVLAGCVSSGTPGRQTAFGYVQTVPAGRSTLLGDYNTVSGDGRSTCHAQALPAIRIITRPAHGEAEVAAETHAFHPRPDAPLAYCAGRRFAAGVVRYRPQAGYRGPDFLSYEVVFADGSRDTYEKGLTVR